MSAERTVTTNPTTTDLLARQEGAFERCAIRDVTPVSSTIASSANPDADELTVPQSCFDAQHLLIQLETVDGEQYTLALSPEFTAYDNRLMTVRTMLDNGFAWYAHRDEFTDGVRDWNAVLAPTRERAHQLDRNGVPFGALTVGEFARHLVRTVTTVGGLFGQVHDRSRPSDVLTAYDRQYYTGDLPAGDGDLETFLRVAPTEREPAEVVEVPSHNKLVLVKDGYTFPLHFSGRATDENHTPTALAESLGVGTVEQLVGEPVTIAPNVHTSLLSFEPVGANRRGTFALGTPR